jgi:hypothetical protein
MTTLGITGPRAIVQLRKREFGTDRGVPIDRYYIEKFLDDNAAYVRGHVLSATAFLQGLALEELTADELETTDPDYQVVIHALAQKRSS